MDEKKDTIKKTNQVKKAIEIIGKYITGLGRRKEATAQVRLFAKGEGRVIINGRELKDYFPVEIHQMSVLLPFTTTGTENQFDVTVRVVGGGIHGQADAVRLGIARALIKQNEELRVTLRKAGLITRDARKKERKKFGKRSARRSPQWSKR